MEVEVVFPHVCGAFYQAYIQDLDLANGKIMLSFPKEWKQSSWVELGHVRYPPGPTAKPSTSPGTKVEAFLPHHDNEPAGWWTGHLLKSKGELHVVEFQSGNEKYQDIVEHDKLRLPNENPPLSKIHFFSKEFPVPEDMQTFCQRRNIHNNFSTKIKAVSVSYDETKNSLVVVADNEACLDRAFLLIDMHFRDLATQKSLLDRNEFVAQKVSQQQQRQVEPGVFEVKFFVPGDLVGLAIGRDGANVNEVRRMTGIISVEFDDYSSMFCVKAESGDVLAKAREMLEFNKDTMLIPRNLAGKVIGKRGNVIQEILDKSKVNNVKVVGDEEAKQRNIDVTTQVPFDFIGRKNAIENAKLMMNYHLDHLTEVEHILQSRREMDSQLQGSNYGDLPTHYFPSVEYPLRGRGGRRGRGGFRGGRGGRPRDSGSRRNPNEFQTSEQQQHEQKDGASPRQVDTREEDEIYQSDENDDSESDSDPSVEEEEPSEEDKQESPPEDDDRGPDRRRQRGGGRGGGGRGNFGRRGRFRGGGRGYRHQRQGRGGGGGAGGGASGWGQSSPKTDSSGGWPQEPPQNTSPKSQRPSSGGRLPQSAESAPTQPVEKQPTEGQGSREEEQNAQ